MCEIFLGSGTVNTLTAKLDGFERKTTRRERQPAVTEASCGMLLETSENTQKRLLGGGFSCRFPVGFTNGGSKYPTSAVSGTEGIASAPEPGQTPPTPGCLLSWLPPLRWLSGSNRAGSTHHEDKMKR